MSQQTYTVGDKTYSREQLIAFGKEHYPKFYWISRGVGILLMFIGFLLMAIIGLVLLILNLSGVLSDPEFPTWVFFIPLGVFGTVALAGIICFILSFVGRTEEKYINHALAYLTKHNLKINNEDGKEDIVTEKLLTTDEKEKLARYERLLKGGVISQEEYEQRVEEIMK
jgi:hypothetical protein